eukprot:893232-Prorocentrum_minimum.AAC.1
MSLSCGGRPARRRCVMKRCATRTKRAPKSSAGKRATHSTSRCCIGNHHKLHYKKKGTPAGVVNRARGPALAAGRTVL